MNEDEEILEAFLEESREGLDQLELDLVELETRPQDPELLGRIYRSVHSIKGTCGFLGYHRLETLTHRGEDVLDELRSGRLAFAPLLATSLLRLADAIRAILSQIESTGDEGAGAEPAILAELSGHLEQLTALADSAAPPLANPPDAAPEAAPDLRSALHESAIRVDVEILDTLMDLVGELVLVRGELGELAAARDGGELVASYRQLRRISGELLDGVMRARLQPVGIVTRKFPRIARDLAASMGKQIAVELEGEGVGVDRAVNESLGDALLHLVRNIADHGIEAPPERIAAGKPAAGRLRIAASHEGGRVRVEISDDGRGIDPAGLVSRARAAGLITPEAADGLAGDDALELIFLPGLSTKANITSVSGRGVGMDAVRVDLARVGGSISVASEPGRGTCFRIDVPLTVAVLPAVVLWCGGGRYCVPQGHIEEVVYVGPDALRGSLDGIDGARLLRRHGARLPLVELSDRLGVSSCAEPGDGVTAVVVESGGRRFGIVVDAVGESVDAVVKPLPRELRRIPVFSGVTIMSDGRPSLIIDPEGLGDAAGLSPGRPVPVQDSAPPAAAATSLLVATGTDGRTLAVDMSKVWRLEQFGRDRLQRGIDSDVVDYGETLLPLVRLDAGAHDPSSAGEPVEVIVCESSCGRIGLVVGSIEDVVAGRPEPSPVPGRAGLARLEPDGRVAELLDVETLLLAGATGR